MRTASLQESRTLELPTDGKTTGERRVDEFLKTSGVPLRVERNVETGPNHEQG
jgi:hypothetical protein